MTFQISCDSPDLEVRGRSYDDNPAEDSVGKTIFRDGYADVLVKLDRPRHGMKAGTKWLVRFVSALNMAEAQKAVFDCDYAIVAIMKADEEVTEVHVSWAADATIGMHISAVATVKNRSNGHEHFLLVSCTAQKLAKSSMN